MNQTSPGRGPRRAERRVSRSSGAHRGGFRGDQNNAGTDRSLSGCAVSRGSSARQVSRAGLGAPDPQTGPLQLCSGSHRGLQTSWGAACPSSVPPLSSGFLEKPDCVVFLVAPERPAAHWEGDTGDTAPVCSTARPLGDRLTSQGWCRVPPTVCMSPTQWGGSYSLQEGCHCPLLKDKC